MLTKQKELSYDEKMGRYVKLREEIQKGWEEKKKDKARRRGTEDRKEESERGKEKRR